MSEQVVIDQVSDQTAAPAPIRVLLATDGSEAARDAEDLLAQLRLPAGSAVHTVTVLDAPEWKVPLSLEGAERVWAEKVATAAEHRLQTPDVEWTHSTPRGSVAPEIVRAAEEFHADLLLIGSTGYTGLERFLLGSVTEAVARKAPHSVLVARRPSREIRQVVVASDGSDNANRALQWASELGFGPDAQVTVCHAMRPYYLPLGPEYLPESEVLLEEVRDLQRKNAMKLLDDAGDQVFASGKRVVRVLRDGEPADQILELAAEVHADLIIMGARGTSPLEAFVLGSVSDRVLRHAHCSVLLAR